MMQWLNNLFTEQTPLQALIVLSLIIAVGLGLGKLRFRGVSLGVAFVFFAGILAGHLGLAIDPAMLAYAENFGLALFVYELGLKVGPGFFNTFRTGGVRLNLLCIVVILLGTAMAIAFSFIPGQNIGDMAGVLAGATTNTPALGAAQQSLAQLGQSVQDAALGCAVTYPLGVIGVIIALIIIRRLFVRPCDMPRPESDEANHTYIATFRISNPAIFGMSIKQIVEIAHCHFVISRLWHNKKVVVPDSHTVLHEGDRLLAITTDTEAPELRMVFGTQEEKDWNRDDIDWNAIDSTLVSRHVVISKPGINGRKLGSLHLRNSYGINISRVMRAGVQLLATPDLVLQLGDRLTVVGRQEAIDEVAKLLGNTDADLKDPNLAAIFIGLVLGLILGAIPIMLPGLDTPVKIGLAGGPMIVGILVGRFGPNFHLVTYTTRSANLMLRGIGLSLFLACLGLDAGAGFLDTIMRADGMLWIGLGFLITMIPVLIMAPVTMRWCKVDFGRASGMLCGAMANPMALDYINGTLPGDSAAVIYATVYPVTMVLRVVLAQIIVLTFS